MSSDSFLKRMPAIATTEYNDITHQISYRKNAFGFLGKYSCEDEGRCGRFMRPLVDQEARLAPRILISMHGVGLRAISETLNSRITDAKRSVDHAALNSQAKQGKT
jgi:hypothetical protein